MQGRLSRRGVVAGGVAAGLVAAPFVRGAYAAGTITIGLWDHWVPGANDVTSRRSSRNGPTRRRSTSRSTTSPARATSCCSPWRRKRRPSPATTSWSSPTGIPRSTTPRSSRSTTWSSVVSPPMDRSIPAVEYLGKFGGHVARRADDARHPAAGLLHALRHDEGAWRRRRAGALSRRQAAQRRELDVGRLPGGGREVPEGRRRLRPAARLDHRHQPVGRRAVPGLWRAADGRQGQRHGEVGLREAGAGVRQEARGLLPDRRDGVG